MNVLAARGYKLAVHEAGHAITGHILGLIVGSARWDFDGGIVRFGPAPIETERDARRAAMTMWSGELAENLFVAPRIIARAGPVAPADKNSDRGILFALGSQWGGADPVQWVTAAKHRAGSLLALNRTAVLAAAIRLMAGKSLHMADEPLLWIKPNDSYLAPFPNRKT